MTKLKCIIMGAAGRDFHDFLTFLQYRSEFELVCFTATQIPFIESRSFPAALSGDGYPNDIPIYSEERLESLIEEHDIDFVFFSYSDIEHTEVMHRASRVQAAGASFALLGPKHTQLRSEKPVVSITAARTGAGKSPICQAVTSHLVERGVRTGVLRHPMPYGDLAKQRVQRFAAPEDFDRHDCTVEEREEYAPYVERGLVIFAGVDYAAILAAAERESDVILWDGGNNDTSFVHADLSIVVVDALRAGHEQRYYPGETNFRAADVVVINKVGEANAADLTRLRADVARIRPNATVIESDLAISVSEPDLIRGRRALVVEDGPTLTHGGMAFGAGVLAARRFGAKETLDPRPHAVGTIAAAFEKYPHLGAVLPALGYSEAQRAELKATIERAAPDVVIDGSPARLENVIQLDIPVVRVGYSFDQQSGPDLLERIDAFLREHGVNVG